MAPPAAPLLATADRAPDAAADELHPFPEDAAPHPRPEAFPAREEDPEIPHPHPAGKTAPVWLAEELRVERGAVMKLEISSETYEMYTLLLRYLGSRAVDIDEEKIPRLVDLVHDDPFSPEREFPGRLSSLFNSPEGTFVQMSAPPEKEGVKGPREVDILFGLGWAKVSVFGAGKVMARGRRKGKKKEVEDAGQEAGRKGGEVVKGVCDAGNEVVDGEKESGGGMTERVQGTCDADKVRKADDSVDTGAGHSGVIDGAQARNMSADAPRENRDAKDSDGNAVNAKVGKCVRNGISAKRAKKKKAIVKKHVFVNHYTYGDPIVVGAISKVYRTIVVYGESAETVQTLCRDALEWQKNRSTRRRKAAPGRFVLHTLEIRCSISHPEWISRGHQMARSLQSVILPPGMMDAIVNDISAFKDEGVKKWYVTHGLPHRRSYLFYGPPGVGKTSTIRAIAGKLKLPACFLCLGDKRIGNRQLQHAIATIPKPSILVMEDIDVLFSEDRKTKEPNYLTFSGLLNALDGMISADGIVTIMTTNHVDRLDPALIRAGRVDRRFEFKPPNTAQVADMFQSYYPNAERKLAQRFADKVFMRPEKDARSIATLQLHFIRQRKRGANECVERLEQFFSDFYPNAAHRSRPGLYS